VNSIALGSALLLSLPFFVSCGKVTASGDATQSQGGAGAAPPNAGAGTAGWGGAGGEPIDWQNVMCLSWEDMNNAPIPGKVGNEACPRFHEIDPKESWGYCYYEPDPEEAIDPPSDSPRTGDCCYNIVYLHCR
jgi:hypothetical protein